MKPEFPNLASRKEFLKAAAGAVLAGRVWSGFGCEASIRERFCVEPGRLRSDEPFIVLVGDLSPGDRFILKVSFDDTLEQEWSATAFFEADAEGNVDTSRQAPVGGSYRVRDPMGLIWSALGPGLFAPPHQPSAVLIEARPGDQETEARVERWDLVNGASFVALREDGLVGRLFLPAETGAAPGVLVLCGSEGGLSPYVERQAMLLASRGYAALAYFKDELFQPEDTAQLADALTNVPIEYFGRALRLRR